MSSNDVPQPPTNFNMFEELSDDSNHTDSKIATLFNNVARKIPENNNDEADDSSEETRGTVYVQFSERESLRHQQ